MVPGAAVCIYVVAVVAVIVMVVDDFAVSMIHAAGGFIAIVGVAVLTIEAFVFVDVIIIAVVVI